MELVKVNGELHMLTSLDSALYLVDECLGRELKICIKNMIKEKIDEQLEEKDCKIEQLENKIEELEEEQKLNDKDCFHLEKDKEYINQQYEILRKDTEKLLDYLYSAKRIDKKKIIAQLENTLNSGENVPLF